ncbi:uncharacterized protein LOC105247879 isoform X1 [Camponotus floridanus]|uniref:uncharacterized protein LOC105247879 isoform X1 n=2 Tax=Camponotus floridanus TaxID=104421 RepID=UPI00059DA03E|nr:uncharacterized protein LOC105247879 isoform X1 [Camponotus floridanus]
MGKTPKKAAPGGDERNLYVRRLKATTAPSRASESSLHERQRESESFNRPKLTGVQKKIPAGSGKNFKSKLRPPTKGGFNQASKQLKLSMKNPEAKTADMQLESEEAEVKLNVSIQKENIKEENGNNKVEVEESIAEKEHVDNTEQTSSKLQASTKTIQEVIPVGSKTIPQEKEGVLLENVNIEIKEMEEENDIKLTFDVESSSTKNGEEKLSDKRPKDDSPEEVLKDQLKNGTNEKEEIQSEAQTDTTESYSVDIVESTTSELSETSESISQSDTQKDKEKIDDIITNEASVSYDSSALKDSYMLKDVHVMLVRSDCVKDNSKLFDVSNMESTPSQLSKNLSFGKTLRNISGRHSIGRARSILRDRISPNSSLFVNTSDMSIGQDEGIEPKVLHYSSLLSDTFPRNGSPLDRKRKIEKRNWDSAKKQKTDEESSLNTSINLVKGFVKPMLISTPKSTPYKFESTKLDISGIKDDDNKITTEESTKKWCVIM